MSKFFQNSQKNIKTDREILYLYVIKNKLFYIKLNHIEKTYGFLKYKFLIRLKEFKQSLICNFKVTKIK